MPSYMVRPQDLGKHIEALEGVRKTAAVKAIQQSVFLHGKRLVVEEIAATRPHQPVDVGAYRQAWDTRETEDGAILFNPLAYAAVIELGRRPGGKMPPVDRLAEWVKHKGLVKGRGADRDAAARGIAFVIARKIAQKGIPAKRVLYRAASRLIPYVKEAVGKAITLAHV